MDEDVTCMDHLSQEAALLLMEAHRSQLQIVTVESCTGGLLASILTDVEGLSHVFNRGLVTYCNEAKIDIAFVPDKLLKEHGPVSDAVAQAMAIGGRLSAGTCPCLSLAITGYAGPSADGGKSGLVYVAASTPSTLRAVRQDFDSDDRDCVRLQAVKMTVALGLEVLK